MVEELKNIPSYQGNDAVKSICIGNKGKIKVRAKLLALLVVA